MTRCPRMRRLQGLNMDKKGSIAVALAIIVMVVWQLKFAPKYVAPPPAASPSPAAIASASPTPVPAITATAVPVESPAVEESVQKIQSPSVEYDFTNRGGGIARAVLLKHAAEADKNVVLNEFGELPIGAISER